MNGFGFMLIISLISLTCGCKLTKVAGKSAKEYDKHKVFRDSRNKRLDTIEKVCQKHKKDLALQSRNDSVPHLIVDAKRKILFCAIPKVASTNWKRVFIESLNITGPGSTPIRDVHSGHILPDLRDFAEKEQDYILRTYFKFMFVRHPLERLLSAYRNKFENREVEWLRKKRGAQTKTILRVKNEKPYSGNASNQISFREFVGVLTDPSHKMLRYNTHWKHFYKLCHPCYVQYDFIGKMDTFVDDMDWLRRRTNMSFQPWFGKDTRSTTQSVIQKYYATVPKRTMERLRRMYETDMAMYSYERFP